MKDRKHLKSDGRIQVNSPVTHKQALGPDQPHRGENKPPGNERGTLATSALALWVQSLPLDEKLCLGGCFCPGKPAETYRTTFSPLRCWKASRRSTVPLSPMSFLLTSRYRRLWLWRSMDAIAGQQSDVSRHCSSLWGGSRRGADKLPCPTSESAANANPRNRTPWNVTFHPRHAGRPAVSASVSSCGFG